jgi:hypothetical protein
MTWASPLPIFSCMRSFKIGGVEEHVHVFCSLSKNIAFSDLIGRLKGASSKRLKEKGLRDFGWQNGYGAFSVSESNVESVTAYIPPRVGRPFRAGRFISLHPGLKRPTSQSDSTELAEVLRRGWLFGVPYHNMRGAIASATAAWAILLDRSAVARKRPNSRPALRICLAYA